jgi:predicted Zn-dependent protease
MAVRRSIDDLVAQSDAARKAGDLNTAIAWMKAAAQKDLTDAGLQYRAGKLLLEAGRHSEARSALNRRVISIRYRSEPIRTLTKSSRTLVGGHNRRASSLF